MTPSSTSSNTIQASCHDDCCIFDEFTSPVEDKAPLEQEGILSKEFIQVVELELGSACNLDCPLCHRNWKDAQHLKNGVNQRPVEDIIRQLDEFPNLKTITIAGLISEPTLYSDFFKLVKYITSRNVLFYIYTNADTHNKDRSYWKQFGELCNEKTLVYFTICGTTQELHEKYRVGSQLDNILKNHQEFRSGMKFKNDVLQYLKFEYNYKDYDENIDSLRKLFSRESSIESMAYRNRFELVNKKVDDDVAMRKDLSKKYETIVKISIERFKKKEDCKMDCPSYKRRFVSIDNTGKMFPCYLHRIYNSKMHWDFDYTDILKARYDFCYECEKFTSDIMKTTDGLLRIVEC